MPTALHLARELVRADELAAKCAEECDWDHAEHWLEYRERLQGWRFDLVRGLGLSRLRMCPECRRVQELEPGLVRCFNCDRLWITP